MKKYISFLLTLIITITSFTGCGSKSFDFSSGKISVVCTIFPEYDWAKQVIGESDSIDLHLLTKDGVDLHSYQPSVEDIARISTCDIFIYVGGESDDWVEDVLKESLNPDIIAINLLEVLGDYAKEEQDVNDASTHNHSTHEDDDIEYDEHIWLSIRNAELIVNEIKDKLILADETNKSLYTENADNYIKELSQLDEQYISVTQNAKRDTVLFADRFPFRYLFDDYDISYYAAFNGCSAETEASFETITFLADKVNTLNLDYVLLLEKSDDRIAKSIIQASNNKSVGILTLDSMQSAIVSESENQATYLSIMESNLKALETALN